MRWRNTHKRQEDSKILHQFFVRCEALRMHRVNQKTNLGCNLQFNCTEESCDASHYLKAAEYYSRKNTFDMNSRI